jgi:hypothetical protein
MRLENPPKKMPVNVLKVNVNRKKEWEKGFFLEAVVNFLL